MQCVISIFLCESKCVQIYVQLQISFHKLKLQISRHLCNYYDYCCRLTRMNRIFSLIFVRYCTTNHQRFMRILRLSEIKEKHPTVDR